MGGRQQDRWKIVGAVVSLGTLGPVVKTQPRAQVVQTETFVDLGEVRRGRRVTAIVTAPRAEVVPIVRLPPLALQAQTETPAKMVETPLDRAVQLIVLARATAHLEDHCVRPRIPVPLVPMGKRAQTVEHRMEPPVHAHAFVLQAIVDQIVKPSTLAPSVQMARIAKMGGNLMASQGVVRANAWKAMEETIARRHCHAVLGKMEKPAKMVEHLPGTAAFHLAVAYANQILSATIAKMRRG